MSSLTARSSVLLITAMLCACAGHKEVEQAAAPGAAKETDLSEVAVQAARPEQSAVRDRRANEMELKRQAVMNSSSPMLVSGYAMPAEPPPMFYQQNVDTERYAHEKDNPVHVAREQPVSTFSIDVIPVLTPTYGASSMPGSCRRRMRCASRR